MLGDLNLYYALKLKTDWSWFFPERLESIHQRNSNSQSCNILISLLNLQWPKCLSGSTLPCVPHKHHTQTETPPPSKKWRDCFFCQPNPPCRIPCCSCSLSECEPSSHPSPPHCHLQLALCFLLSPSCLYYAFWVINTLITFSTDIFF